LRVLPVLPYCAAGLLFNATPPAPIPPLSLHDALPISDPESLGWRTDAFGSLAPARTGERAHAVAPGGGAAALHRHVLTAVLDPRSEEHTSELQSRENLVCRLLLEKKKTESTATHVGSM